MVDTSKIYILGASCSGVSTLGEQLSQRLGISQLDVDDFYWMPTDPPFTTKRPPEERVKLIAARQKEVEGWVLTGSSIGWGDTLVHEVDLIVFIYTPTYIRLQRLDKREALRHGERIRQGGDMHQAHLEFREWASSYDDPLFSGRNCAQHERWLKEQTAPVLRLAGEKPLQALVDAVERALV